MTCLCVRLSDVNTHDCAGLYVCVFVCSMQIERQDRLLPCCSLQGLWLARLSRTETSASICVAAPRPYWWAATSCNRHALCRSTPPVGESRAGQETCEPPCETNYSVAQTPWQVRLKWAAAESESDVAVPLRKTFFGSGLNFKNPSGLIAVDSDHLCAGEETDSWLMSGSSLRPFVKVWLTADFILRDYQSETDLLRFVVSFPSSWQELCLFFIQVEWPQEVTSPSICKLWAKFQRNFNSFPNN